MAPNGRLYVTGQDQAFTGEDIVASAIRLVLTKLCSRYRNRDLLVIWDGATIHRAETVKALLRAKPGRIHLEALPGYSPEFNPVELVWNQLRRSLKNQVYLTLWDLTQAVLAQLKVLEADRKLIQAFFNKKEVGFFTDQFMEQ